MPSPAAVLLHGDVISPFPKRGLVSLKQKRKCEVSGTGTCLFKILKQHLAQQGLDPKSSRFSAMLNTMNQQHHSEENLDINHSKDRL